MNMTNIHFLGWSWHQPYTTKQPCEKKSTWNFKFWKICCFRKKTLRFEDKNENFQPPLSTTIMLHQSIEGSLNPTVEVLHFDGTGLTEKQQASNISTCVFDRKDVFLSPVFSILCGLNRIHWKKFFDPQQEEQKILWGDELVSCSAYISGG